MKKYKSIRTKLIVVIFISIVLTAVFCIGINSYNFIRFYYENNEAKLNAYAQGLIKAISEILKSGELGSSGVIIDWIGKECERIKGADKEIAYIAVTDKTNFMHYNTDKKLINSTFKLQDNFIDKVYPILTPEKDYNAFVHIGVEKKVLNKKLKTFVFGGGTISFIILLLIMPISYFIVSKNIVKPLKKITFMLTDIAEGEGDLTKRLEWIETRDEFELFSKKFNKFVDKIQKTVIKVKENTEWVANSAIELSKKTEEMKEAIAAQTQHTVEVATAIEEMSGSILEVAKNAEQTKSKAEKSSELAKGGEVKSLENIEIMDRLVNTVEISSGAVNELGKLSDFIDEILKVIEEIADQTNLLALNAAIEAARAGDAGKGFAVVADEVRKLAEKTAAATKDIGKTVTSIKEGTMHAVNLMNLSKKQVQDSKEKIYEARTALSEIVTMANSVTEMVTYIATASSEQSAVSEEINRAVTEIKNSVLHTSSGTEFNLKLALELKNSVKDLENLKKVLRFRINGFYFFVYLALNSLLSIFPCGFLGSASTNSTERGALYFAILSLQKLIISSALAVVSFLRTISACTLSTHFGSGTPMTAASNTAGC